jgi:hypothetical protein
VKPYAGKMLACVENARTAVSDQQKVAELAGACAVLMGW